MNNTMKAMVLEAPDTPLHMREVACPLPGPGEVLLRVSACGVCRTELRQGLIQGTAVLQCGNQ